MRPGKSAGRLLPSRIAGHAYICAKWRLVDYQGLAGHHRSVRPATFGGESCRPQRHDGPTSNYSGQIPSRTVSSLDLDLDLFLLGRYGANRTHGTIQTKPALSRSHVRIYCMDPSTYVRSRGERGAAFDVRTAERESLSVRSYQFISRPVWP